MRGPFIGGAGPKPFDARMLRILRIRLLTALDPARLREAVAEERDRLVLWAPVLLAAGIALYYALPAEPPPALLLAAALPLVAWWGGWPRRAPLARLALVLLFAGFAAAKLQVERLATPVLERPATATVLGRVAAVEPGVHGPRLDIVACRRRPLLWGAPVRRVRLVVRTPAPELVVGDVVRVFASLAPPGMPRIPGGFDPGRRAWLAGIGASGHALAPVYRYGQPPAGCAPAAGALAAVLHELRRAMSRVRLQIAARVRAVLPAREAGLAVALLTGQRGYLDDADVAAMRDAGLAHLLAISGLHLGLVAAGVFWLVRLMLALWPRHAESRDGKRPAAAAALVAITGYLLVSGASIATERAFIMTGLALVAVMLRRDPFSLRLLAFAATVMLLRRPSDLLEPGFQMSYLAVAALIGVYEALRAHRISLGAGAGGVRRLFRYLAAVLVTTAVAEAAIAPAAIQHFGAIARYGLIANLVAVPVTAFVVMPAGLAALLLMPLGLENPALRVMGHGARLVLETAQGVAALPGAVWHLPLYPAAALIWLVVALAALVIWRAPLMKLSALAPALVAAVIIARTPPPDILIGAGGRLIAVREDARLWVNSRAAERGSRLAWQEALGIPQALRIDRARADDGRRLVPPLTCGRGLCVAEIATATGPVRVALATGPATAPEAAFCRSLDLLVLGPGARDAAGICPGAAWRITADRLAREGAHAVFVDRRTGRLRVLTVRATRGARPWSR
ncbi:MAG: competence protein ComEC [Rhodothalassiaceae bacterium]|nr:MAG: competence protein ComEC [Rhodothalassiaceae bacterium]